MPQFTALRITETPDNTFVRTFTTLHTDHDLPPHEILIKVQYAALNYKDALSASGNKGITRQYPHTPGIDAAGVVAHSTAPQFAVGSKVMVTGYDLGMNTNGAFAEYIRVPAAWVVPLPEAFTPHQAMIMGTAAFTAALALHQMERNGQHPNMGSILITGATGGVGSLAVAILSQAGYKIIAATGKPQSHEYLTQLGATEFTTREAMHAQNARPLLKAAWAGAIDNIGGDTLAHAIKACAPKGNVAACGLVADHNLNINVFPFILRGVNLLGVDSAETKMELRLKIWQKLSTEWNVTHKLQPIATTIPLNEINHYITLMLQGNNVGRVVVAM